MSVEVTQACPESTFLLSVQLAVRLTRVSCERIGVSGIRPRGSLINERVKQKSSDNSHRR